MSMLTRLAAAEADNATLRNLHLTREAERASLQRQLATATASNAIFRRWLIEKISGLRQHQIDPEVRDELLNEIMAK